MTNLTDAGVLESIAFLAPEIKDRDILVEQVLRSDLPLIDVLVCDADEAADAMRTALSQGTQDAQLFYHVGVIERALGHTVAADDFLAKTVSANPSFHAPGAVQYPASGIQHLGK